jgi:hypothetical protein
MGALNSISQAGPLTNLKRFSSSAVLCSAALVCAQANQNAVYQQLRSLTADNDVITVTNLVLQRDAATLTLTRGAIAYYPAVNGKITGAVFRGEGHIHVNPPSGEERHNLLILTGAEQFDEDFDRAVLRFTDGTADDLRKAATGKGEPDAAFAREGADLRAFQEQKLFENIDLRVLEDVLAPGQGSYFLASIHGKKHPHLLFTIDPNGAPGVSPEEVLLSSWSGDGVTYLTAFRLQAVRPGTDSGAYRVTHEDLDTSIEKNGFLTGQATVQIDALQDGEAVVPLALYPTLRVSKVEDDKGKALDFVQENKESDADFAVILASPLKKGESTTVRISYAGKDVVRNEGNANYYPMARDTWYPNSARGLGDFATYNMQFHVPRGLQLLATGTKVSEHSDGKITTSVWKTDLPLAVVGFNLGSFNMKEAKVPGTNDKLVIEAYANKLVPDDLQAINRAVLDSDPADHNGAIGQLNTVGMLPEQLSQGQAAAQLYSSYFGQLPFARVALTQQFACNYGQSWPMLVYLPICGFLDSTQQHYLGLHPEDMYWKIVTAHEVAHQWWGQTVGFRSYRDQWMSEGFADASASIYLQSTEKNANEYRDFWKQEKKLLTEKNTYGFRPVDVGPVTMGFRLAAPKTGWSVYRDLVYPKGAYILHMIRRMMWSARDGDNQFIQMMSDFANTYRLRPATTEDFKAEVEKYMTPAMDLDGNHRMDWFFDEFVYGTQVPNYHLETQLTPGGEGGTLHFSLSQSGVPDGFKSLVPLYLELADGRVLRMGQLPLSGSASAEQTVALPKLPSPPRRALINYYYDVLSTDN